MKRVKVGMAVLVIVVSFFLVFGGSAIAENGVTDDEIVIGSTMDLSGPIAFAGQTIRNGALMYFKYINEQGGINGRKIKFIVEDDGYQSPRAVQGAKKLVTKDKVFCMSMNLIAHNIAAMTPFLEENKVPMLPAGSGNESIVVPFKRYIFTVDTGYPIQGHLAVKYMMTTLKAKNPKVAVLYQDGLTGKEWLKGVKTASAKYGIKDVLELSFKPMAIDFSSQVSSLKKEGITHVFMAMGIREPALIMKEAQRVQYRAVYFAMNASHDPKVLALAGDAANYSNGYYIMGIINDYYTDDTKGYRLYKQQCQKAGLSKAETESTYRIWGFQAAITLSEVLKRTGKNLTREGFIKAAETMKDFDNGIEVPTTWGADRRDGGRSVKVYKADKGNWIPVSAWLSE